MWHIDEIVKAVKGTPLSIGREFFTAISTDSRSIQEGELFIPLSGNNYDGHAFIPLAYDKSQGGSLCEKGREDITKSAKGTMILVDNTLQALIDLAKYKRKQTKAKYIAITGSNGKTTTKEILIHIIKNNVQVHYNEKNYNNIIGVSKSILSMERASEFCVFELGTNSKGEIRTLAEIIEPDISLITNINPSHLEGLFDLDGVLEEKMSLFEGTKEGGTIFLNADDPYLSTRYKNGTKHALSSFGIIHSADFNLAIIEDLGWKGYNISLKLSSDTIKTKTGLLGIHNLYNVLAAASIAYTINTGTNHIARAIESFDSYSMRFQPVESGRGYMIVNDTYNANPSSMQWAIKTLVNLPCRGKRIAILGDMKELGEKTSYYHKELGKFLRENNIPMVVLMGEYVKDTFQELGNTNTKIFDSSQPLVEYVSKHVEEGDVVLVKGSRALKMEEIVEALI
jgi:UDP-N-acetylmuramoyl-tripeptide--D-alanyl-D-alanine ligase